METKNIFISHIHEDDDRLQPLKDILAKNGCDVRDASINSNNPNRAEDPDYIKNEILSPRINWASTVIVLISPDAKDSEYVQWEIEHAEKLGKRIVGIWDRGEEGCEMPEGLDDMADAVVPWNGEKMVAAILGEFNGIEGRDGTLQQARAIARYNC